jgi:phage terminase large subunit-like protein
MTVQPTLLQWPATVPRPLSAPALSDASSDGPAVIRWIERNCRHGEGEKFGEPVELALWQKLFLTMLFELRPDGTRRYKRCLLCCPKNSGKTPLAAWIAAYMLATQKSPVIPVAAASFEQAGILFDDLRICITESPTLRQVFAAFENEIQVIDGPGRAYRVAAVAGTNDGQRPTLMVADETHEWQGPKARVHLVLSNGCAKRRGSLELNLTTPGTDKSTLAGKMHDYGVRVNNGELVDDSFLFVWFGAEPDKFDLDTPDGLRAAIRAAQPGSDIYVDVEAVAAKYHQIPASEFARYFLAQWHSGEATWLPEGAFDACAAPDVVTPEGVNCVLGFDGSFAEDSCALVMVSNHDGQPHLEVAGLWEKPEGAEHWTVPILDVEETIRQCVRRFNVREIVVDPWGWRRTYQTLAEEGANLVDFPQNPTRMCPSTQRTYELVMNKGLTHSGDPRLLRHFSNAILKPEGSRGARIVKDSKTSTRKVDLVIASIMALDRFSEPDPNDYNILESIY